MFRRLIALLAVLLALTTAAAAQAYFPTPPDTPGDDGVAQAYAQHLSHVHVEGGGVVLKLLPDDTEGDRHQRFIVRAPGGERLLFAYNIDIAPRIDRLRVGDGIRFAGEYIWNRKGGIVHWTHHDPSGRHVGGYIDVDGRRYQ